MKWLGPLSTGWGARGVLEGIIDYKGAVLLTLRLLIALAFGLLWYLDSQRIVDSSCGKPQ